MSGLARRFAVSGAIGLAVLAAASRAPAQLRLPPARAPCSVLSGHPCHPSFCSVFHHGPCFPEYPPPLGEDLRTTIVSSDDNPTGAAAGGAGEANGNAQDHAVDTIRDMFAALRACWQPPPTDKARHGMEYTVRFAFKRDGELIGPPRRTYSSHDAPADVRDLYGQAVDAALKRCIPLHFSDRMAGAIAGRPIAIRFIDNRTLDKANSQP